MKQFEEQQKAEPEEKKTAEEKKDELDQLLDDENPENQSLSKQYKLFNYV